MNSPVDLETSELQKCLADSESALQDRFSTSRFPLFGPQIFFARVVGQTLAALGGNLQVLRVGLKMVHRAFEIWWEKRMTLDLRVVCVASMFLSAKFLSKKFELRTIIIEFVRFFSVFLQD